MDMLKDSGEKVVRAGKVLKRMLSMERKRVYEFGEGCTDKVLLGIKGATLCELTQLGLPVPPGFVITTENFTEYISLGEGVSSPLESQYRDAIRSLECITHRKFAGRSDDEKQLPLLLSVRAGTAVIVPGMMDSILNVGMSDSVVEALINLNQGYTRFALDLHRRFLYMFGTLVLRNATSKYERVLAQAMDQDRVDSASALSVEGLTFVVGEFKRFTSAPDDPYLQLRMVIEAMYQHSFTPRVSDFMEQADQHHHKPRALSITVQAMVYGNLNSDSGSGVAFSRRPDGSTVIEDGSVGAPVGEFLRKAEGNEVLHGDRTATPVEYLRTTWPTLHEELLGHMRKLEERDSTIQYVEFTVENGKLYILETSDVNLRPNTKDSRYVVYYDLLIHLQEEEERDAEFAINADLVGNNN